MINKLRVLWILSVNYQIKQRVIRNGQSSDNVDLNSGARQGSIWGPLFFLIYINDLPEGSNSNAKSIVRGITVCTEEVNNDLMNISK